jgi:hypothetical protein
MRDKYEEIKVEYPSELEIEQSIKKVSRSMKKSRFNMKYVYTALVTASLTLFLAFGLDFNGSVDYLAEVEVEVVEGVQVAHVTIPKGDYSEGDYVYLTLDESKTAWFDSLFLQVKASETDDDDDVVGFYEITKEDVPKLKKGDIEVDVELVTDQDVESDEVVTNVVHDGKVFTANPSEKAVEVANENASFKRDAESKYFQKKLEIAAKKLEIEEQKANKEAEKNQSKSEKLQSQFARMYQAVVQLGLDLTDFPSAEALLLLESDSLTEEEYELLKDYKSLLEDLGLDDDLFDDDDSNNGNAFGKDKDKGKDNDLEEYQYMFDYLKSEGLLTDDQITKYAMFVGDVVITDDNEDLFEDYHYDLEDIFDDLDIDIDALSGATSEEDDDKGNGNEFGKDNDGSDDEDESDDDDSDDNDESDLDNDDSDDDDKGNGNEFGKDNDEEDEEDDDEEDDE